MLRWYRREGLGPPEDGPPARGNHTPEVAPLVVSAPTLVIYSTAEQYPHAHEGLERYVPDLPSEAIDGALHWVAEQHPDLFNRDIRDFIAGR